MERALVQDYMGSGLESVQGSVLDSAVLKQELTLGPAWVQHGGQRGYSMRPAWG